MRSARVLVAAALLLAVPVLALGGRAATPATRAATPATPATPAIPLAEYAARLETARSRAEADAPTPSRSGMDAVRAALGLPLDVQAGSQKVHLDRDPDLESLSGRSSQDFREAADRLAGLEDSARDALATPTPDQAQMRSALAGAYQGVASQEGALARIRHDIWAFLLGIWQRLTRTTHGLPFPSWVVDVGAVAVVLGVAGFIVYRMRFVVPERGSHRRDRAPRVSEVDWHRLAEEALARGDFRAALRARYGALLAALAARGVIPDVPSLTAGECRRAVAGRLPDAFPPVQEATAGFEAVFFGRAPAHREEVDAMSRAEAAVRAR